MTGSLRQLALDLRADARVRRQRRLLVLAGPAAWGREKAAAIASARDGSRCVWVNPDAPPGCEGVAGAKAIQLLGGECGLAVFDAHAGFDPDAFGAVSGLLSGGGLFVLLTPAFADWPASDGDELARLTPAGVDVPARSRFLTRLVRVLADDPQTTICTPDQIPGFTPAEGTPPPLDDSEQQHAVQAVTAAGRGRARRPVVLTADRGRGKSAALGMAAAELIREGLGPIAVTAPRFEAAARVFEHAAAAGVTDGLDFFAPDALVHGRPPDPLPRLLLVDEAAGIPAHLLAVLLERFPRIAFATTVHGYEGTGRGFALRFAQTLDARTPGWKALHLTQPIRWAGGDPLERLAGQLRLLATAWAGDAAAGNANRDTVTIERVDRDALLADEDWLAQIHGLLVAAHYRTRPFDLRLLLDGPAVEVFIMRAGTTVVATALVAHEGGLDPALGAQVWAGERRPHGHLMPEVLAVQAGVMEASTLACARVIRVAVHPAARRRGLGRALIEKVRSTLGGGCDLFGASFGASPQLLDFWARCGMAPVTMGVRRGRATGERAALMVQPLTDAGAAIAQAARARLQADLPYLLAGPLADLEPETVAVFAAAGASCAPALSDDDWRELVGFAFAARGFEPALRTLHELTRAALSDPEARGVLAPGERAALIVKVLQQRGWETAADALGLSGRKELLATLRVGTGRLLVHYAEVLKLALDI